MTDLTKLSVDALLAGYGRKEFLPSDVIQAYRQRYENHRHYNTYTQTCFDEAQQKAELADKKVQSGSELLSLEGLPLAVKDNFAQKNKVTSACSAILKNFKPFYDSTITARLEQAGCIAVGTTNMDEFAMGSSTENSIYGPTINPWKSKKNPELQLSPGGSSGGSAAAVAARLAAASIGTDTGGSIRQPAAFNGLVGFKPTYGRCSRYGIVAFASSLDQAGPITRTVMDSIRLFETMSGVDTNDSTTAKIEPFRFSRDRGFNGITFGLPVEFLEACTNNEIKTCWLNTARILESKGAQLKEISLPHIGKALAIYYIIAPAEAASNLARYDGVRYGERIEGKNLQEMYIKSRSEGFGEEVKRRIMVGNFVLSSKAYDAYYLQGLRVRNLLFQELQTVFQDVDLILSPTTPTPAFALGSKVSNPMEMYQSDLFTVGANLAGIPAISVPISQCQDGLPMGVQLMANAFHENLLFNAALDLEDEYQFHATLHQEIQ
ncbi:MAG: Asp-tRNA(Asn)/Glu-tRNA(Gln) amidotransferase GatCAB subunit A [Alphaproteobacteria bacterium]|nr:MAG: Asp-tRNA(Asn)/Glu-tRNA(Gln) amidotransferase GatCAB subunit A [Alphaproteobacteria bacterium]